MRYVIRDAGESSVESLCQLFEQVFGKAVDPAVWRWKYLDEALSGHENVVLADESGAILGHAGAIILPGSHEGRPVPIAQLCDVMLAPAARGQFGPGGPYASFMKALIAKLQSRLPGGLYYGFPGHRPFRLGERLGLYRGTGPISELRETVHPRRWSGWRICELDWQDPLLDRLWVSHAGRPGCLLVRDRRYLSWRYARNPLWRYRLLGLRSGFKVSGWMVVKREGALLRCIDRLVDETRLNESLNALAAYAGASGASEMSWWPAGFQPRAGTVTLHDTQLIGVVLPASAPEFAAVTPFWQPGDADVY